MATLRIDNLSFHRQGPYSFSVDGGQCCGLSGPSGSGKTLLLRSLADLDPHGGRVVLGNILCEEVQAPQWRKLVGMLPAESCWWFDSVEDHFSGERGQIDKMLIDLGFEADVMSWQVRRLSTGEKQRLSIVRLLTNHPQALLLDEPTANLDSNNIDRVESMLLKYCKENVIPLLWVSHNQDQLDRVADNHLLMHSDRLIFKE